MITLASLMEGATSLTDLSASTYGYVALAIFAFAYTLVVIEDVIHLRKSKPVVFAAGAIWILFSLTWSHANPGADPRELEHKVLHHLSEFAALFLFLMVAMTYISAIAERNVFLKLNAILVSAGFGFRSVFWVTGALSFVISPIADNLTTALLMGAVVSTVGGTNKKFIGIACTNVVIAANAGGAFSPFGDITTLMVWQAGKVEFGTFFALLVPSLVNWLVPAAAMHFAIPAVKPEPLQDEVKLKEGWLVVTLLFLATIATAVSFHSILHLPPFLGMMTGLSYFFAYGYYKQRKAHKAAGDHKGPDVFGNVADVEWDTLLFFFGVIMCVSALGEFGYLAIASETLYNDMGPTTANIGVGVISAILDNVPVMLAVLQMDPAQMDAALTNPETARYQWLLVTLTAGVGGSLLSVGSAAGVALMGSARGNYSFFGHLKWTPVIGLGYAASIVVHYLINCPN